LQLELVLLQEVYFDTYSVLQGIDKVIQMFMFRMPSLDQSKLLMEWWNCKN
jgi:hypothetical protein